MYRLLIVSENEADCQHVAQLIDQNRYGIDAIRTANTYVDAISTAVDFVPHIAIIDTALGGYPGYVLATHLRSMGIEMHFCMISNTLDIYHMRKAMQACALDYLSKPVAREDLLEFLERVIVTRLGGSLPNTSVPDPGTDPILQLPYSQLSNITNKIILCVKTDFVQHLTLAEIASQLRMNSKYIGRIFLRDTGIKYSDYLLAYRMHEARRLIINTQEKISVIAGMVGYSQQNNFHIDFKQFFHTSPSKLRQYSLPSGSITT